MKIPIPEVERITDSLRKEFESRATSSDAAGRQAEVCGFYSGTLSALLHLGMISDEGIALLQNRPRPA